MLGWLCIVQSLWAYTPGIRAGAVLLGLPPLIPVGGFAPATPFIAKCYSLYLRHLGKLCGYLLGSLFVKRYL